MKDLHMERLEAIVKVLDPSCLKFNQVLAK